MEGEGITAAPSDGMEGEGINPASDGATTASSSPPHDLDIMPIVIPENADSQSPPSDDEHSSATAILTDDLRDKIIKQVEYYFSDENLPTDKYLLSLMKKNREGFGTSDMSPKPGCSPGAASFCCAELPGLV